MSSMMFYLGRHPDVYTKLCKEVRTAFNSTDEIHSGPALNSCVYLRACLDETMRISPPVGGALWREAMEGGLTVDGELIPAGVDLGVGIYAIHHNKTYYPEPSEFRPERWLVTEQNSAEDVKVAKSAFIPFSKGPRNCVGKGLAYMEISLVMARMIWMFDFRVTDETGWEKERARWGTEAFKGYANNEFHLRDQFTSWKNGPMVSFRPRDSSV